VQAAVVGADLILTVEDHSVIGGLGTCVAEALSKISNHAPLIKCGVQDLFGESAEGFELYDQHGFSAQKIVKLLTQ
jgi:transketolase